MIGPLKHKKNALTTRMLQISLGSFQYIQLAQNHLDVSLVGSLNQIGKAFLKINFTYLVPTNSCLVRFRNSTIPWGVSGIWAGAGQGQGKLHYYLLNPLLISTGFLKYPLELKKK